MAQINLGSTKIKKIFLGNTKIKKAYVGSTRVFASEVEAVDLVKWYGWSQAGNCNGVNSWGEAGTSYANGLRILSGASTAGLSAGRVWQNISMIKGHKYWLYFGYYSIGGMAINTPIGNYSYSQKNGTISTVVTYSGTTGNAQVYVANTSSDDTASDYCRLCSMNIVDLTACFGSGDEPTAAWCASNLGIFNGTKTVEV